MADDADLIVRCRAGEGQAWDEIYRRYHRLVRAIARSYGATEHDAEEVVQITFAILHRSMASLHPDSRLGAWLSTVARRHTWRVIASRSREVAAEIADEPGDDDVARDAERSAEAERLHSALRSLPPRCRALMEALYLRDDEPSYEEISRELGMPVGSIGPTRARCLEKLRRHLISDGAEASTAITQPPSGGRP